MRLFFNIHCLCDGQILKELLVYDIEDICDCVSDAVLGGDCLIVLCSMSCCCSSNLDVSLSPLFPENMLITFIILSEKSKLGVGSGVNGGPFHGIRCDASKLICKICSIAD